MDRFIDFSKITTFFLSIAHIFHPPTRPGKRFIRPLVPIYLNKKKNPHTTRPTPEATHTRAKNAEQTELPGVGFGVVCCYKIHENRRTERDRDRRLVVVQLWILAPLSSGH